MNKKMREILAAIEAEREEAKKSLEAGATDKAQASMDKIADLEKQYTIAEALYKAESEHIEDHHEGADPKFNQKDADIKAFSDYVRAMVQKTSTPQNITIGNNGAIIPVTIAGMIVEKVKELCPIYANSTMFHSKGTLKIPVWGNSTDGDGNQHNINVAFAAEFTELTADAGKFTSVDLTGYLVGALALIGKDVVNNSDIDITNFIVNEMSKSIAAFLEDKLLNGAASYNTGVLSTTTNKDAAASTAITADELIDVQDSIPTVYQAASAWYMAPATFTALRKLKDSQNRYLIQDDFSSDFPRRLLGKPVYLSDNMPAMAAGNKAVLYGDVSGLAVNVREDMNIEVLTEKYATQHAIGVVAWMDFDSKIIDNQKLCTLTMKAGA